MKELTTSSSRRHFLAFGAVAAGVVGLGAVGLVELVDHGVLPGQSILNDLDGACTVDVPPAHYGPVGDQVERTFFSRHRGRTVGYTLGLPANFRVGDDIPLVVFLHGFGQNHRTGVGAAPTPAQAIALRVNGNALPPFALVTVDGGPHYWHVFGDDDPMAMITDELIPRCQALGPGRSPGTIGVMGLSMGGYGAVLFAERRPDLFRATAALSPAIWTDFASSQGANEGAFVNAANFAAYDVVTHADALSHTPTFLASGFHDPFYPGAQALAARLPGSTPKEVIFANGCHGGDFYNAHAPAALAFLTNHLT